MSNHLKQLRNRLRLTQSTLAERLGVSQQTIARWESGASPIPSKYLKDLAILFGGRVSDFVGGEPASRRKVVPLRKSLEKKPDDGDVPYGTAILRIGGGPACSKAVEYAYPVTHRERNRLLAQIEHFGEPDAKGEGSWLDFETLDNRWVIVNGAHLEAVRLQSEAADPMPDYEHVEVYKAARALVMDDLPRKGSPADDDYPVSEQLLQSARSWISDVGGSEAAMCRLLGLTYEFVSGERHGCTPEDDALAALVDTFQSSFGDVSPSRMIDLEPEQYHQSNYVRLVALRLIEVSWLWLEEWRSEDVAV